jgi:SAM-dependent methyltransferase
VTAESEFSYVGTELDLFADATNWKSYWAERLRPFVRGDVLDVGAGLGATFEYLNEPARAWTCLEPDPELARRIEQRFGTHAKAPRVLRGTTAALPPDSRFDTVLYIDVLEHIEHDAAELERATTFVRSGGSLIVLSPAHPLLYSPFDASVGHFRRYTARTLRALTPPGVALTELFFLDGLGACASLFARVARRREPTKAQIRTWDRLIVPVSRATDRLTRKFVGRSVIAVWTRD